MRQPSLTRRLIWTLGLGATLLWLLIAFTTAATLRTRLYDAFDGGLRETAERLLSIAAEHVSDPDRDGDVHEVPDIFERDNEYLVYQLRRGDGRVLLRSHDAPAEPFAVPLIDGFADAGPWRVYTMGSRRGLLIQVGELLSHREDSLSASVFALVLPVALLLPLTALGIFFTVRLGLRPVRRFSEEIGERHAANLAPLAAAGLPVELVPIAGAVDGLIERLRAALEAERAFAANSAHELRTPIAGSLAQTQLLIAELGDGAARGRAQQIETSLTRLNQLAEKLLQLSRADAGIATIASEQDLVPALTVTVEDARRRHPGRTFVLTGIDKPLSAAIDIDAFGIVLRNALDNAALHGASTDPITIEIRPGKCLEIANGGPAIDPDTLAGLKQRFARGNSKATGSGLGLAIIDTIMRQIGGSLELASPIRGQANGFMLRLKFDGQSDSPAA